MTVALAVVLALVVLGVLAVLVDRLGAGLAERRAAELLTEPYAHSASVRLLGAPFLTQVLRGRYRDVRVKAAGLTVGEMRGATLDARLHDVQIPVRELFGRRVTALPCRRLSGRLVLPYHELARVSRVSGLTLEFRGGDLHASATLPVPGLGALTRVGGRAVLSVDDVGTVWLRLRDLGVPGLGSTPIAGLSSMVVSQLMPRVTVPITVPRLPFGLRIDELTPTAGGLAVDGSADDVVLTAPVAST